MNWFLESPLLIALLGIGLLLVLGALWSASGRKELLVAIVATILLTGGGILLERFIVTDREAIRATLLAIAEDVESNDLTRVARHIYSGAPNIKAEAEVEMPNYKFDECRVTKVHSIDVNAEAQPRTATVEFNVVAGGSFSAAGMSLEDSHVPRWVRLQMVREKDGRWTVADYDHAPPQQMIFNQPLYNDP